MLIVIAVGGNAITQEGQVGTWEEQRANARVVAEGLVALRGRGHRLVLTHGNGPQVGALHLQQVGARRDFESRDGRIEIAMLLLQPRQLLAQLALFLFGHRHRWYPASEGPHSCVAPSGSDTSNSMILVPLFDLKSTSRNCCS